MHGVNSGLRGSNKGKTLLNQLLMFTKWPLIRLHWHLVKELSKRGWRCIDISELFSIRDWRMWLAEREYALS